MSRPDHREDKTEDRRRKTGLTLSRRQDESILIECPDGSEIIITSAGNARAHIRINAPDDYVIERYEEIYGTIEHK